MRTREGSIAGIIRRTRSIQVDTADPGVIDIRTRHRSDSEDTTGTISPPVTPIASIAETDRPEYFHSTSVDKPVFTGGQGTNQCTNLMPNVMPNVCSVCLL